MIDLLTDQINVYFLYYFLGCSQQKTRTVHLNCGCDNCNIDDMINQKCPNPVERKLPEIFIIRDDHEHYLDFCHEVDETHAMCVKSKTMREHYKRLYSKTISKLKNIPLSKIEKIVYKIKSDFSIHGSDCDKVVLDIEGLIAFFKEIHVSWFNFRALYKAAKMLSIEKLMNYWKCYELEFKDYADERTLNKELQQKLSKIQNVFIIELDETSFDIKCSDIQYFRRCLADILDCDDGSLYLLGVKVGSLLLYFYYCCYDYLSRFKLTQKQLKCLADVNTPSKILNIQDLRGRFVYTSIQSYSKVQCNVMCMYVCVCVYVCMYVYVCICMYLCVCMLVCISKSNVIK